VPAAEVADLAQALDRPQAKALGAVQELGHPAAGAYRLVGPPLRIDRAALAYPAPAPPLGSGTRAVLCEAGLSSAHIDPLGPAGAGGRGEGAGPARVGGVVWRGWDARGGFCDGFPECESPGFVYLWLPASSLPPRTCSSSLPRAAPRSFGLRLGTAVTNPATR